MRAREFITANHDKPILREYKRDITAQRLGPALYKKFQAEPLRRQIAVIDNKDLIDMNQQMDPEQRKAGVVNELLQKLERADPTPNKQYVQWLVRNYIKGTWLFENVLSTTARHLAKFYYLLVHRQLKPEHRDINQIKGFVELLQIMRDYSDVETEKKTVNKGQSEEVYSDENVRVVRPLDEDAACYYGRGTRWCTAATEGENYFNEYNQSGPLYILLPTKPRRNGEKYQLHFADAQYMNENDEPIDLPWLLKERFPGLFELFLKLKPDLIDDIQFAPDDIVEGVWREVGKRYHELLMDVYNEFEKEDRGYQNMIQDVADDMGISAYAVRKMPEYSYAKYDNSVGKTLSSWDRAMQFKAGDIRKLGAEYSSDITGESASVTQIPMLWVGRLGVIDSPYPYLDEISGDRIDVLWTKAPIFKDLLAKRRFYREATVGDYVIGELGGFK